MTHGQRLEPSDRKGTLIKQWRNLKLLSVQVHQGMYSHALFHIDKRYDLKLEGEIWFLLTNNRAVL